MSRGTINRKPDSAAPHRQARRGLEQTPKPSRQQPALGRPPTPPPDPEWTDQQSFCALWSDMPFLLARAVRLAFPAGELSQIPKDSPEPLVLAIQPGFAEVNAIGGSLHAYRALNQLYKNRIAARNTPSANWTIVILFG